jgi:hypothetical protein
LNRRQHSLLSDLVAELLPRTKEGDALPRLLDYRPASADQREITAVQGVLVSEGLQDHESWAREFDDIADLQDVEDPSQPKTWRELLDSPRIVAWITALQVREG